MGIVPKARISFLPIFRILKLLAFYPRMFRRRLRDETILSCTKPFFPCGADIPKPSLINNPPNETPLGVELGACHVERRRHQRRSQEDNRRCPRDLGRDAAAEYCQGRPHVDACALLPP